MLANTPRASCFPGSRWWDVRSHLHTAVNGDAVIRVEVENNNWKYTNNICSKLNTTHATRTTAGSYSNECAPSTSQIIVGSLILDASNFIPSRVKPSTGFFAPQPISTQVFLISAKSAERHCWEMHSLTVTRNKIIWLIHCEVHSFV